MVLGRKDRQLGSDARNVLRLITEMRKRGLERWGRLAVVGYSGDPMSQILGGTGLEVDFDLEKSTKPIEIINAIQEARRNRLTRINTQNAIPSKT